MSLSQPDMESIKDGKKKMSIFELKTEPIKFLNNKMSVPQPKLEPVNKKASTSLLKTESKVLDTKAINKVPIVIHRNKKITLFDGVKTNQGSRSDIKINSTLRVEKLFEMDGDSIGGFPTKVIVINHFDTEKNTSRTVAQHISANTVVKEMSSDQVAKLIGQTNYDMVFSALCSVINQDLKTKAIMALLTASVKEEEKYCQTDENSMDFIFKWKQRLRLKRSKLQPYVVKDRPVKTVVMVPASDKKVDGNGLQSTVATLPVAKQSEGITPVANALTDQLAEPLPVLKPFNEDSNSSTASLGNISTLSGYSMENLLDNATEILNKIDQCTVAENNPQELTVKLQEPNSTMANKESVDDSITKVTIRQVSNPTVTESNVPKIVSIISLSTDKHIISSNLNTSEVEATNVAPKSEEKIVPESTKAKTSNDAKIAHVLPTKIPDKPKAKPINIDPAYITMMDGTQIMVPVKPEDHFHIASPDILMNVTMEERRKLIWYQAYIDWKLCLQRDEDDNLPIHMAVMNEDTDLVRRQCMVLKNRNESVDVTAGSLTPLHMSILQDSLDCTVILLSHGADVLMCDEEHRTALHLAAEGAEAHMRTLLEHARGNARAILMDHEELWREEMANQSDEELATKLLGHMCSLVDNQGYTPLMLAAKMGHYANVRQLISAAPDAVDQRTPNSGDTALYLAIGAASLDAEKRGNKSKIPEHFARTIGCLVSNGASLSVKNHANIDVKDLLIEFNIAELSTLVANRMYTDNFGHPGTFKDYMIVKNKQVQDSTVPTLQSVQKKSDTDIEINKNQGVTEKIIKKEIVSQEADLGQIVPQRPSSGDTVPQQSFRSLIVRPEYKLNAFRKMPLEGSSGLLMRLEPSSGQILRQEVSSEKTVRQAASIGQIVRQEVSLVQIVRQEPSSGQIVRQEASSGKTMPTEINSKKIVPHVKTVQIVPQVKALQIVPQLKQVQNNVGTSKIIALNVTIPRKSAQQDINLGNTDASIVKTEPQDVKFRPFNLPSVTPETTLQGSSGLDKNKEVSSGKTLLEGNSGTVPNNTSGNNQEAVRQDSEGTSKNNSNIVSMDTNTDSSKSASPESVAPNVSNVVKPKKQYIFDKSLKEISASEKADDQSDAEGVRLKRIFPRRGADRKYIKKSKKN